MNGTDGSRMMSAIMGKAMEPPRTGTGVIEVAMSIQYRKRSERCHAAMRSKYVKFIGCCLALAAIKASAQNTFPATGNVGIGTNSPSYPLSISSNSNPTTMTLTTTSSGGHQWGFSSFGTLSGFNPGGLGIADWTAGAWRMYLDGSGNVGVGTSLPGARLEVNGNVKLTAGSAGSIVFPDGTVQSTAWTSGSAPAVVGGSSAGSVTAGLMLNQTYVNNTSGGATSGHSYKIATLQPNNLGSYDHLHLLVTVNPNWAAASNSYIDVMFSNRNGFLYQYVVRGAQITSAADLVAYNNGTTVDIYLTVPNLNAFTTVSYTILENQQETVYSTPVDVGTSFTGTLAFDAASSHYPAATYIDTSGNFTFAGNVKMTQGTGTSMTYQDGTVQTTAWNGVLGGGDYAESVDVSGDRTQYEPGDVLVIDPTAKGRFAKSAEAYSTAVMGIYSTRPGVVGRRQTTDKSHMRDEVPMAMVGVVPTKVTAESGSIKPGDLLVTSSKPGYAMKGTDRSLLMGAIIGKALEPLDAGTGVIEVAVSIQ